MASERKREKSRRRGRAAKIRQGASLTRTACYEVRLVIHGYIGVIDSSGLSAEDLLKALSHFTFLHERIPKPIHVSSEWNRHTLVKI